MVSVRVVGEAGVLGGACLLLFRVPKKLLCFVLN